MKHFQLSLLLIYFYSVSAAESHHFNFSNQSESPCDNPELGEEGHLRCQDFEFFIKAARLKKKETETSWFEWAWPLWKIKHDQSLQKIRTVQEDINYYETLLSKKRPDHYRSIFEYRLSKSKLLFNTMKKIADKENFEELYNERHSLSNAFSTAYFPLTLTGVAWYYSGMPVYTSINAGLTNHLSDHREINREHSWWATANTVAKLTANATVPAAIATGDKKYLAAAGISYIVFPLAHNAAIKANWTNNHNKAETIFSPNAQVATGIMELMTWGPMLYYIAAQAYYIRQQKDNYPFKEKTSDDIIFFDGFFDGR